jgi:hypothetical protein
MTPGWAPAYYDPDNAGFAIEAEPAPNYPADLNAMREAVASLSPVRQSIYVANLISVVGMDENSDAPYFEWLSLSEATAAQRAEAFLRTIGKWDENK